MKILIILLILFIILLVICFILFKVAFKAPLNNEDITIENYKINKALEQYRDLVEEGINFFNKTNHEIVNIKSYDDLNLQGYYFKQENAKANIICVHGFHGRAQLDYGYVGKVFYNLGFNVLLIDMRGHGNSEGNYLTFGLKEHKDVIKWVEYINNDNSLPIILDGVSMGGATVLTTSKYRMKNVYGIIDDCGFTSPYDICKHVLTKSFHLPSFLIYPTNLLCKLILHISLFDSSGIESVKESKYPIIVFHGGKDDFVPTYMSKEIYQNINNKKRLVIVDEATHALSYFVEMERCNQEAINFIDQCIKEANFS